MAESLVINYRSKSEEVKRSIAYLKSLGLNVENYATEFADITTKCDQEIASIKSKGQNIFRDSSLDIVYSKYYNALKQLNAKLNYYNKLVKLYEHSDFIANELRCDNITKENVAMIINKSIEYLEKYTTNCDFRDDNTMIILSKIVPIYISLIKKEILYTGYSTLLEFIKGVGLEMVFVSYMKSEEGRTLEECLLTDKKFSKELLSSVQKRYENIKDTEEDLQKINDKIKNLEYKKSRAEKKKNNAKITRYVAELTALVVLASSLLYGANKLFKFIGTRHLYQTTKTTYSTYQAEEKTTNVYETKIPDGKQILVVSYTPWEELSSGNFRRKVTTSDVSDITLGSLGDYLSLDIARSKMSEDYEITDVLTEEDKYKQDIKEVIRLLQNPDVEVLDTDNFFYNFSFPIAVFILLAAYGINCLFSAALTGEIDSSFVTTIRKISENIKKRRDAEDDLKGLEENMTKFMQKYAEKSCDVDDLMRDFNIIYDKYRFLIDDKDTLNKYDSLKMTRK